MAALHRVWQVLSRRLTLLYPIPFPIHFMDFLLEAAKDLVRMEQERFDRGRRPFLTPEEYEVLCEHLYPRRFRSQTEKE